MRIINSELFVEAATRFPRHKKAINALLATLKVIEPRNSSELKQMLPSLERFPGRSNCYRLDVGGRKGLRMIATFRISKGVASVHLLGTHQQYDKFKW